VRRYAWLAPCRPNEIPARWPPFPSEK
jgi:hypothetical protein